jgi:membrane-associated phospholipid phosphatase
MLNRPSSMHLVTWTASVPLLTTALFLCVRYLDIPVAYYVRDHLCGNLHWSRLTSNLPDLLLLVVLLTTSVSLTLYLVRTRKGLYDATTRLEKLVTWSAPASYLVKSVLKFVFGRVNTRFWLQEPGLYGFHWFQRRQGCEGFPSGHMIVIVTLLAALWRFHPKSRPYCLLLGMVLGVALVATNYHFLSDVIAGAYVGVLVEAIVFRLLVREPQHPAISAI